MMNLLRFRKADDEQLKESILQIRNIAKEGDIILIDENYPLYNPLKKLACRIIRNCQKKLFGEESSWNHTHVMVYFNDGAFSAEIPKALYRPMEKFILENISIYRYAKKKINLKDIKIMREIADQLIGKRYNSLHLFNILIDQNMGIPFSNKINLFRDKHEKLVCSIGAGIIHNEFARKNNLPNLFSILNSEKWPKDFIEKFNQNGKKWDIETFYPACFANSESHFNSEFMKIAEFRNGKLIR